MLGQLIDTLVGVVDRRNPYSTNMSSRVAKVAAEIAREMGIEETEVKTIEVAAKLYGVGTVFVPTSVLPKTNPLSPRE